MLRHRFGPLLILLLLVSGISFVIRLILLFLSWSNTEMNPLKLLGIFLVGFFYDLVVWSFFSIPLSFYCWLMKDGWYRSKWNRVILYTFFVLYSFILLLNACSEIAFWQEFSVQYNFIAVDYLFYTTEVLENIWQSYNIPMILAGVLASVIILVVLIRKKYSCPSRSSCVSSNVRIFLWPGCYCLWLVISSLAMHIKISVATGM